MKNVIFSLAFLFAFSATTLCAQNFGISSNLLYDATVTVNIGGEWRLAPKVSFIVPVNYNPFTLSNNLRIKHLLVQPELRYYFRDVFNGSFFGLHAHGVAFNVNLFNDFRYQGWLAGGGVSYGYTWRIARNWALEATVGAGYAYIDYDKFSCKECGGKAESANFNYFGLTKAGLSLIYFFGNNKKAENGIPDNILTVIENKPVERKTITPDTVAVETHGNTPLQKTETPSETRRTTSLRRTALVTFPVNKSTLLTGFEQNASELMQICHAVDSVRNLQNAVIEHITIESYASPEGDLMHNIALSEKRAEAIKNYLTETYAFTENIFTVRSKGENWDGLREALNTANLAEKEKTEILKILDIQDVATRKMLLKQYSSYQYLLKEIYPKLRTTIFNVECRMNTTYD